MAKFRPELETCPICTCTGKCRPHDHYERYLIDCPENARQEHPIRIRRVICGSCGNTHAILPDIIIPYSPYGLLFLLRVLALHFSGLSSIRKICAAFGISENTFLRWLSLWKQHKQKWLGALKDAETSHREFMGSLMDMPSYSDFACAFTCRTARSFLQSHKNPIPKKPKTAPYCQKVFAPDISIW